MSVYDEELSIQYHSLRLYYGIYDSRNVNYRIGNRTITVADETERYFDTWEDFHLIPTERPTFPLPKTNTKIISIPGSMYPIDMTSYLTGHITFGNRTGAFSFYTDNDFVEDNGGFEEFDKALKSILHGRMYKIVLMDDPSYFYFGQLSVGQWNTGADRSTVSISYNVYPYKKCLMSTMDMWKFDDFDFENDIIQYMKDMEVNSIRNIKLYGSMERINPHISGTSGLTVEKYENSTWVSYGNVPTDSIESNNSIIPRFIMEDGINLIRVIGNGTVTIDYRRGLL